MMRHLSSFPVFLFHTYIFLLIVFTLRSSTPDISASKLRVNYAIILCDLFYLYSIFSPAECLESGECLLKTRPSSCDCLSMASRALGVENIVKCKVVCDLSTVITMDRLFGSFHFSTIKSFLPYDGR